MRRDYFCANGEKYYTGTIIKVIKDRKTVEATFLYYNTEWKRYAYRIGDCTWHVPDELFHRIFVEVTDKVDKTVRMPQTKTLKDSQIDGMFTGWLWYITLMVTSTIFNDRIGLWALISYIFFSWRAKKIKKEGTYIEW